MTTTIEFPTENFFGDRGSDGCIPFMTKHTIDVLLNNHLVNPDEKVLSENEIDITFDYPFSDKYIFTFYSPDGNGITRGQLAEFIINKYYQMYKEEEDTIKENPVLSVEKRLKKGRLINRNKTDGKYGIWGHDMSDLSLNCLYKGNDGAWHLSIDS